MHDKELRAKHFQDAEASFLLEGLDASGDLFYQETKARVIAGEIDSEEAIRLAVEYSKETSRAVLAETAAAH
jgi:hypothetical protein